MVVQGLGPQGALSVTCVLLPTGRSDEYSAALVKASVSQRDLLATDE